MHNAAARKSPPRASSTLLQHLGLSRLSSPLNTSTALHLRCRSPQYRPWDPSFSCRCVCYSAPVYTSARFGYRKSACSSRYSIHCFKKALPLRCALAACFGRGVQMRDTTETAARAQEVWLAGAGWALSGHAPPAFTTTLKQFPAYTVYVQPTTQNSFPHVMQAV
jgi:hypothetical protein